MKRSFYRKHNSDWFRGKIAVLLRDIRSNGGTVIKKGERVTMGSKYGRGGFYVDTQDGRGMSGVEPEALDLI